MGVLLAPLLVPGDVLVMSGDLGAGKTTFVQGLAKGLGILERVTSPTFILMKEYQGGRFPLMHLDVYRLGKVQEVIDLGIDEYLDPSYVVVVEWGDKVEPLLPQENLTIELVHEGADVRSITLTGKGTPWVGRMDSIKKLVEGLATETRAKEPTFGRYLPAGQPDRIGTQQLMLVLGIETSTPAASVTIGSEQGIIGSCLVSRGVSHGSFILPAVEFLMKETDLSYRNLSAIAVGLGPGLLHRP